MPSFSDDIETKITTLRGLYTLGTTIEICEMVKVAWSADPDDTFFYATWNITEQASVPPVDENDDPITVEVRLVPGNDSAWFLPVKVDSTVGDQEIDLELWDGDGVISDRLDTFGEGGKVTLYQWFPQVELLLRFWDGHLEFGDGSDGVTMKIKAAQGFRSTQEDEPNRGHYHNCGAVFGGLLATDAEALEFPECPFNKHRGGPIGTNDPDTGLPWTFCDRQGLQSCIDRGVLSGGIDPDKPWYHLSHNAIETTAVNNQTKGPRLYETSHGNDANLSEPVPVIMGTRRKYGCNPIDFRRDRNNRNPDQGFMQLLMEVCEGPVLNISQGNVTVGGNTQPVDPFHYSDRNGEIGQAAATEALQPFNYSGLAHFRYTFGPVNPEAEDPGAATADILVNGLRDVRVYYDAGNGLVGDYYRFNDFYDRMGRRFDSTIDFPSNSTPPIQALFSENGFCAEWNGYISFQYAELYTITTIQDDVVTVWIENTDLGDTPIINAATWPSTGSGTYTPSAINTHIPIRIRFKQTANPAFNPWSMTLKWQSASRSLQVIPNDHLFHDQTYQLEFTRNRVWHIARMLCDKRWGGGHDYAELNFDSWMAAAEWADILVGFTDPFGTIWIHTRALSDVELVARKEQQQIEDMCIAGRLSLPFMFDGKLCIEPLRALTSDELLAVPVFTDVLGDDCNILYEETDGAEMSTLRVHQQSIFELKNQIKVSIDDINNNYVDTPLRPFEDVDAQLAALRARGTIGRKINKEEFKLLGVTQEAQGTKLGWSLLDLGPLDRGGLANNLSVIFKVWFADALDLYESKVIKVVSPDRLTRYGFTYFRIMELDRSDELVYTLTCQAYNETYMAAFEDETPLDPPDPPMPPSPDPLPCILQFGTITYADNLLSIPIDPC